MCPLEKIRQFGEQVRLLRTTNPDARSNRCRWVWALALVCGCAAHDASSFSFSVSSGGGFTGLVRGCRMESEGRIVAFERRGAQGESILWTHSTDAGRIRSFAEDLQNSGVLGRTVQQHGNVTASIVYSTADSTFVWTWAGSEPKPPTVAGWYRAVKRHCAELKPDSAP